MSLEQTALVLRTVLESAAGERGRRRETALRTAAILWTGITTGLRSGALLRARLSSLVDNGGRRLLRYHLKGHADDQEAVLPEQALAVLDAYLAARANRLGVSVPTMEPTAPLFASIPIAGRSGDKPIDGENFSLSLRAVARSAGIPHADELVPHSLRHTSGTALHRLGLAGRDVQEHLRHASLTTTGSYLHASADSNPAQVLATELTRRIAALESGADAVAVGPGVRAGLDAVYAALSSEGGSGTALAGVTLVEALRAVLDLCDHPGGSAAELAAACRVAIATALPAEMGCAG